MCAGYKEQETAFGVHFKQCQHWCGRQDSTAETHVLFMAVVFVRSSQIAE